MESENKLVDERGKGSERERECEREREGARARVAGKGKSKRGLKAGNMCTFAPVKQVLLH